MTDTAHVELPFPTRMGRRFGLNCLFWLGLAFSNSELDLVGCMAILIGHLILIGRNVDFRRDVQHVVAAENVRFCLRIIEEDHRIV